METIWTTSVCQSFQSGRWSLPSTTMLIVPGTISATGTAVGMGVVSDRVGVTPTSVGGASAKGVDVGIGVGVATGEAMGVVVSTGIGSGGGVDSSVSLTVDVMTGGVGEGRVDDTAGDVRDGVAVARVGGAEPDVKSPLIDKALSEAQIPAITTRAGIHLPRAIYVISCRRRWSLALRRPSQTGAIVPCFILGCIGQKADLDSNKRTAAQRSFCA
jgi:hypothetical protein